MRYERACSQLAAAKEMVNLAEQGYFKESQQFDPAWQEMLNHSTMKVMSYSYAVLCPSLLCFTVQHYKLLWPLTFPCYGLQSVPLANTCP